MAYNKEEIYEEVIKAIKDNNLRRFDYIEGYIEPCTKTLYEYFPIESNELHTIKRELEKNKIASKTKMVGKWESSDNPTLQIAAFKLIATDEERKCLSTNFVDHSSGGKELLALTDSEREERIKELKEKLRLKDEQ